MPWSTATGRPTAATYAQLVALDDQVTAAAARADLAADEPVAAR